MSYAIAIDGPAGAGKSTIAKKVAKNLGYIYVDTGAMYRAIALYFVRNSLDVNDMESIQKVCQIIKISIVYENGEQVVLMNGENVNPYIRTQEVAGMASKVSAVSMIREKLVALQQEMAMQENVVMDGRDIGTVVLPNAELKVFLTASAKIRALRRYEELCAKNESCVLDKIEEEIIKRDEQDMTRKASPLKQASDAILLDSSDMTIDEVVEKIMKMKSEKEF